MGIRWLQVGCIVIACVAAPGSFVQLFYPKNRKIELTAQLNEAEWMAHFQWANGNRAAMTDTQYHYNEQIWLHFDAEKNWIRMVRRNPLLILNTFCANWIWSSLTHKNRHKMHWKIWQKWRVRTMVCYCIHLPINCAGICIQQNWMWNRKKVSQETKAITTNKQWTCFHFVFNCKYFAFRKINVKTKTPMAVEKMSHHWMANAVAGNWERDDRQAGKWNTKILSEMAAAQKLSVGKIKLIKNKTKKFSPFVRSGIRAADTPRCHVNELTEWICVSPLCATHHLLLLFTLSLSLPVSVSVRFRIFVCLSV